MSQKQDGRKKTKAKTSKRYPKPGRSFNFLEGADRQWAKENRFDVSERCVGVTGGNRFGGSDDTKRKCGDGRSGFSTRREWQDEIKMEVGLEGQYKKKRSTLVNPQSARCAASRQARRVDGSKCGLASSAEIHMAARDPIVVAQQERAYQKSKRKEKCRGVNRNKVRRAAKRNRKAQLDANETRLEHNLD